MHRWFHVVSPLFLLLAPAVAQLQWHRPEGPLQLTPRFGAQIVDDTARGRLVLFGGGKYGYHFDETWEWDGSRWNERFPAVRPPARSAFAFAYDGVRGRAVLFGGTGASNVALADLWEWDGTSWNLIGAAGGPSARSGVVASYDYGRAKVVVFGGLDLSAAVCVDPHWEWDGTVWSQGPAGPAARANAAIAYDLARGRTVLMGGRAACVGFSCPPFGDTWEFNGTSWALRTSSGPPARLNAAMTFDPIRSRVLLVGGQGSCTPGCTVTHRDAWEWDGTTWAQRSTQGPQSYSLALAYDLTRATAVSFGGIEGTPFTADSDRISATTSGFDGTNWTTLARAAMPPAIHMPGVIEYDAARRRTVFFGNAIGGIPGRAETWEYDGSSWLQRTPATSPPPRTNHAMSYDSGRQRLVLFGGTPANAAAIDDTWEWDGTTWSQVLTAVSPPAQFAHAMAYDSVRARTVLYPGAYGTVFEFDGTNWLPRTVPGMPPSRTAASLAFDRRRGRTVLFGGLTSAVRNDTWEWDGTSWTEVLAPQRPAPRSAARLVYDDARGRLVLFGGAASTTVTMNDLWEYDGANWTMRQLPELPRPRSHAGFTYDSGRGRTVLFGGYASFNTGTAQDTWELYAPCDRFGPGEVAGGGLAVDCTTPPGHGSTFCVGYSSTVPAGLELLWMTPGGCGVPTAVTDAGLCAPGLFYAPPALMLVATSNPATFCVALPNNPAFVGLPLCVQGASLAAQGCFLMTDSLAVVVQ